MKSFKKGDKVRYAVEGTLDWETKDWAAQAGLVLGSIYTIERERDNGLYQTVVIVEAQLPFEISSLHFVLERKTITRYDILKGNRKSG